jgi:hypothetical protein
MYDLQVFRTPHLGQFAYAFGPRFDARMADNRTISQLEAEGYPRMRVLQGHRVGAVQDAPRADPDAERHDPRPARRQDAL